MIINNLLRNNIRQLTAYSSARSEFDGSASVYLDANENAWGAAEGLLYSRYPDPMQKALKDSIARLRNISPAKIFLGNGSDEPIDLLVRAFCEPGVDNMIAFAPTYGMYQVTANINNVELRWAGTDKSFQPDVEDCISLIDAATKIIFICSPNNPTGNLADSHRIECLLRCFNGIVIVDEAYIDFAQDKDPLLGWLETYSNLVVLQTFSKAWSMAGLRLGVAFAAPEIVEVLNKVKPPYNISEPVQQLALNALNHAENVALWTKKCKQERERVSLKLANFRCVKQVYPSQANFLLTKFEDAGATYQFLLRKGIVVRDRSSQPGCENCLRITIGTSSEMDELIEVLTQFDLMPDQK